MVIRIFRSFCVKIIFTILRLTRPGHCMSVLITAAIMGWPLANIFVYSLNLKLPIIYAIRCMFSALMCARNKLRTGWFELKEADVLVVHCCPLLFNQCVTAS